MPSGLIGAILVHSTVYSRRSTVYACELGPLAYSQSLLQPGSKDAVHFCRSAGLLRLLNGINSSKHDLCPTIGVCAIWLECTRRRPVFSAHICSASHLLLDCVRLGRAFFSILFCFWFLALRMSSTECNSRLFPLSAISRSFAAEDFFFCFS